MQNLKVYSFNGKAIYSGFIKNGFDSSRIINIIVAFDSKYDEFKRQGYTFPPHLFYYHEISRPETIGVLINKFHFTRTEAIESFDKLIKEFNLEKICRINSDMHEQIVEEANDVICKNDEKLRIGKQDIIIIAGFLREKINFIHADDAGFAATCKELKLNIVPIAKRDRIKEKDIKKLMKHR